MEDFDWLKMKAIDGASSSFSDEDDWSSSSSSGEGDFWCLFIFLIWRRLAPASSSSYNEGNWWSMPLHLLPMKAINDVFLFIFHWWRQLMAPLHLPPIKAFDGVFSCSRYFLFLSRFYLILFFLFSLMGRVSLLGPVMYKNCFENRRGFKPQTIVFFFKKKRKLR